MSLAVARIAGRVVPGVEAARAWSAASVRNGGERARMLLPAARGGYGGERETLERLNRERLSTVAGRAVGPARSSDDSPAWRGGRRSEGAGSFVVRRHDQPEFPGGVTWTGRGRDRKSTRLNSSHSSIS